ncbi:MAG TPA: glycine-rich protein [Lacunisphaera sp.]|nr:glycine-rich protein [Lacunisphaera sp.]
MNSKIHFPPMGKIVYYLVPASGRYVIEAAGAQGGAGGGPGGRGARVRGTFQLDEGDVLQIVVGQQGGAGSAPHHPADIASAFMDDAAVVGRRFAPRAGGGGGGGSFVWKFDRRCLAPLEPLLVAGGGGGGSGGPGVISRDPVANATANARVDLDTAHDGIHYSGGDGAGWLVEGSSGSAPTFCAGGAHWHGGSGAIYNEMRGGSGGFGGGGGGAFFGCGSGGGGGYFGGRGGTLRNPGGGGGTSYNAGENQSNLPGVQTGDGFVSLVMESAAAHHPFESSPAAGPVPTPDDGLEAVCGDAALARALRPRPGSRPPI